MADNEQGEEQDRRQFTMTAYESTLERLEELYPHLLKPQHRFLAAVEEVELRRREVNALASGGEASVEELLDHLAAEAADRRDDRDDQAEN